MNPRNNIKVSLKNPSDFFEHKQNEVLVKELARKKLEEEEKLKNKKFAAPKEYFGEDKEVVAEIIKEEEIKEETPVNPPEVKSYDEDIKRLQEKVDSVSRSIPTVKDLIKLRKEENVEVRSYDEEIKGLNTEVKDLLYRIASLKIPDQEKYLEEVDNLSEENQKLLTKIEGLQYNLDEVDKSITTEGLLNIIPSAKNSDPLTPLDQKFVTLQDLSDHYRLFVNRVQQQLSVLGGGGAVRIEDLEDVDISSAMVDGKVLEYDSSTGKWKGGTGGGGSVGLGTTNVSTSTLNVVGFSTFNDDVKFNGNTSGMLWDHSTNDLILYDDTRLEFGSNKDFEIWHGGSHTFLKNTGGDLRIRGDKIQLKREDGSERYLEANVNNEVSLFYNGVQKFATSLEGVSISGLTTTTNLIVSGVTTHFGDVIVSDDLLVTQRIRHVGDTDTYIDFSDDQIELYAGGKGILTVTEDSIDSVVINDGSNNCDFRVEGLNDENLIFSDGSTDRVGIGSAIPTQKLDVAGAVKATAYHGDGSNLTGISAGALDSRGTTSAATGSIAQTASANITIPTRGKSFSLLKVAISAPAWVILYVDSASRSSDSSRTEGTDPAPGSGVLTEVSTTTSGASTFLMSPAVLGWNNDGTPATQIYAKVTNKRATSGSNAITVTLTTVKLEA